MTPPDRAPSSAEPLTTEEQEGLLLDSEGKVAPWAFPEPTVSPDYVETLAESIRTAGEQVGEIGHDITSSWGALTGCYESSGDDALL